MNFNLSLLLDLSSAVGLADALTLIWLPLDPEVSKRGWLRNPDYRFGGVFSVFVGSYATNDVVK